MTPSIELLAETCVARGCGFAALAIVTFMVGLSWDLGLACQVGGLLTLLVCAVLIAKAWRALFRPVRKTELWQMLDRGDRLRPQVAQRVIGVALRHCYLRFALHAASASIILLALSSVLQLLCEPPQQLALAGLWLEQ
jgi:hypothetical protein